MNLELILENIRLQALEEILLESKTQEEVQRGIEMINESFLSLKESKDILLQEVFANHNQYRSTTDFERAHTAFNNMKDKKNIENGKINTKGGSHELGFAGAALGLGTLGASALMNN